LHTSLLNAAKQYQAGLPIKPDLPNPFSFDLNLAPTIIAVKI